MDLLNNNATIRGPFEIDLAAWTDPKGFEDVLRDCHLAFACDPARHADLRLFARHPHNLGTPPATVDG